MKHLLLLVVMLASINLVKAQLPDGSTAPDFTATDLDGNTYNLYNLLDQGYTVYLDISATWCGPCWNYHNTHALKTVWDQHGPDGTNEAFVFMIEGDAATNTACLYGPSGCVGGTQGNWVNGTPYPIVDDASIANAYAISYYPTIYMICPADKKVYETGQISASSLWNFRASHCATPILTTNVNNVNNVRCLGTSTGSIDISVSGGNAPYTYNWSNGLHTQDLTNVAAGTYTCTVTSSNGWTGVTDAITVEAPPSALTVTLIDMVPAGCNNIPGSLTVEASGGWSNFNYNWNNGQNGETAYGLSAGTYTVTVTDDNLCTKTLSASVSASTNPVASIAPPGMISCTQQSIQLNGTGSTSDPNVVYQWYASNGGHIVSGATTTTPVVDAAGTYSLQVTNVVTTCNGFASTTVQSNVNLPSANAGPAATVTCSVPSTALQGSGSTGSNFTYLWTASAGGNITAGATTLTPTVNAAGTYTLKVTNSNNGCTQTSSTTVTGNNTPPTVSTSNGVITCLAANATLTTTTNATTPGFVWTGPNNFSSTVQSPVVTETGTYSVVVSDPNTGCTNTAGATVTSNTTAPGASATGAALTCVVNNVQISASSPANTVTYLWTGPNAFTSTLQSPTVSVDGAYNVVIMDSGNGCTSTAIANVTLNTVPPTATASVPGNLNCNTSQVQINATASSQGSNFTYAWTTADGHIVSGDNTLTPLVDQTGTYALLVNNTDNGCSSTTTAQVAQSQAVTSNVSTQTNVSCNGGSNGTALASAGGGNGSYTYAWSNGASTAAVSGLTAGAYSVVVTDGENCTSAATVTIQQPDVLAANASATAQTSNGVNDGTASAAPAGGTAPYSYLWDNSATTQSISNLAPGSYTVSVTDNNGCTSVQTVTVNAFNCALAANISSTNISCFGANDGTAAVALTGANDPVTFAWNNGGNTQSVANLAPGVYEVNVLDANNCPAVLSVTINEPTQVHANATATNETSAGANDGTATATPTGGSGNYTYLWSTNATTASISNLAAGTYTVSVTDGNGCVSVQTVSVNSFNCTIAVSSVVTNINCAGNTNGAVALSLAGGSAPFTYLWSNGATTSSISNIPGGTYVNTLTDANGCQVITTATVNEPAPYSAWTVETTGTLCPNDATGSATVSISGGTMPYSFLWNNGLTGNSINNLSAGNYSVVVTDANGCQSSTTAVVSSTDIIPPVVSTQNATIALNQNGLAVVNFADVIAQASDNCAVQSIAITPTGFTLR